MADLVPVARIPPGGACRQIKLPVDLPQIHQKNAGIDVFRDTGAYQPQAERLGREGSFGLSGGIVQRSGQKAALERNVPKLPDVQIDEDVAVQVDDPFHREQGENEIGRAHV